MLKTAALLAVSCLFALILAEGALRLFGVRFTGTTFVNDPELGWALRPGAGAWEADEGVAWSRINSHGYRDRERTVSKPADVYRVAVLGDSFTEARQVDMERVFTALSEAELNRTQCLGSKRAEVLNFGVGGFGTAQELLLLRKRGWKFQPDMIVIAMFLGNDVYNNSRALNVSTPDKSPYFVFNNDKLELDNSFQTAPDYDPDYIRMKSRTADILNSSVLLQMLYKIRLLYAERKAQALLDQMVTAQDGLPSGYQKFLYYLPPAAPAMREAWRVTEAVVDELRAETRSRNAPLVLMLIPSPQQVEIDAAKQAAFRQKYGIGSLEYADDRMDQYARSRGIPVLRLTRPLNEEAARTGKYVYGFHNTGPNDGHFNEQGHIVVAREMTRVICGQATPAAGR